MDNSSDPRSFADKARDLKTLRNAVIDAATVSGGFWFSYIFVLFYLFIAVGGVTHRDLLFANPVKLPFLNVELPLTGFFLLGPVMFLILHAYVLLHFVLLADKIGAFHRELNAQIDKDEVRTRLRRQLPSNIFVQFLAGPREVRTGVVGYLLRLIAQISLLIAPIVLLVFFQLQFLPYHDWWITWWLRFFVVADLVLQWTLWSSVARGKITWTTPAALAKVVRNIYMLPWVAPHNKPIYIAWRNWRRVAQCGAVAASVKASLIAVFFIFIIATYPGEWLYDDLPTLHLILVSDENGTRLISLHDFLFVGSVDIDAGKSSTFVSDRLVLPKLDIIDHNKYDTEAKFEAIPETVSLRGRHLEGAVLSGATLKKVDFQSAWLQGARLDDAQLQGARLAGAHLQGAQFAGAHLQGALLTNAQLQGSSFASANLQGASLDNSLLHGASLSGAKLQGTSFVSAKLQGAFLEEANLQGASLVGANLQGASLINANLQSADFTGARVWLVETRRREPKETPEAKATRLALAMGARFLAFPGQCKNSPGPEGWRDGCTIETVKRIIAESVPKIAGIPQADVLLKEIESTLRDAALARVERQLGAKSMLEASKMAEAWSEFTSTDSNDEFEKGLDERLLAAGCAADGASYVIHGLLNRAVRPALAARFLKQEHCAGGYGLSENDKATLKEISERLSVKPGDE